MVFALVALKVDMFAREVDKVRAEEECGVEVRVAIVYSASLRSFSETCKATPPVVSITILVLRPRMILR
jgi:hypothetical protein